MRTKTLLLAAAALSAGILASSAQVYSANVVGYVNKVFKSDKFYPIVNPLNASTNSIGVFMNDTTPVGTLILRWSSQSTTSPGGDFTDVYTYQGGGLWTDTDGNNANNVQFLPGQGFFVYPAGNFTNTFVGDVPQGTITNVTVYGGLLSLFGSPVPISGNPATVLDGFGATIGDVLLTWDAELTTSPGGDIGATSTYQGGGVWIDDGGTVVIPVGDAFYYISAAAGNTLWTRQFTVN